MDEPGTGTAAEWQPPQELSIRFVGSGSEYFRIWIVNLLLTLVTIGFYHPFAKARRLVYFHGATEVGGQPLAFLGDPRKMLRGHVLMLVMVGAYAVAIRVSPVAGAVAVGAFALLWPALWHSSLRFRLANTAWRGLRLRFTGSRLGAYGVMAVPMLAAATTVLGAAFTEQPAEPPGQRAAGSAEAAAGLLVLLPLLLAMLLMPLLVWSMRRYQHGHYAWGSQVCTFKARIGAYYGVFFVSGLLSAAAALVVGGVLFLGALALGGMRAGFSGAVLVTLLALVGYLVVGSVAGGYFGARVQNLSWNGTRAPDISFQSAVPAGDLVLMLKNWLLIAVTLGLYYPFAAVASARLRLQAVKVLAGPGLLATVAAAAQGDESAAGDAAGDLIGIDVGL
jgi:uncharacterized membrane protein YjgN (DUF898 family)